MNEGQFRLGVKMSQYQSWGEIEGKVRKGRERG